MKRTGFFLVGAAMIALTSCEGVFNQFGINLDSGYYEMEFAIPPTKAGDPIYYQKQMQAEIDEIMAENGQAGAMIKRIDVTEASVAILEKSKILNFNAIESLKAVISGNALDAETMASCQNNMADATLLNLEVASIDVAKYLKNNEYIVELKGELKEDLKDTLWVVGKLKYEIVLGMSAE